MTKKLFVLFALALMLPMRSRGDDVSPCHTASFASVLGATCTIGDKTFSFDFVNARLDEHDLADPSQDTSTVIKASQFGFAPDTSNPDSPGFTITFPLGLTSLSSEANTFNFFQFQIDYAVVITDPSSAESIIGTTVTGSGLSATLGASSGASNTLRDPMLTCVASATAEANYYSNPSVYSLVTSDTDDTLPTQGCTGLTTASGEILGGILAIDGGSATANSASFYIDEGTPTTSPTSMPEPSSMLLLGAGLLSLGILRRWRCGTNALTT
ncbi:MAG TPA: PEP-CTERM sorting domain-containing protein [Terriglobales bacterium]|nr:PEP-CTERM sorting domain-containing protein [Terriglobales bacterium]